jgi:hypothetical protein
MMLQQVQNNRTCTPGAWKSLLQKGPAYAWLFLKPREMHAWIVVKEDKLMML